MKNPMKKNIGSHMAMFMAASLMSGKNGMFNDHPQPQRLSKKCLLCGKEHYHNNSFCCAEHCREWRAAKRKLGNSKHIQQQTKECH